MNIYETNVKRIIDFLVAFCGLIVLSPAILIIALIVRKEDGGKAFYRGDRLGKDGIPFRIYKFRTMVMNAENIGGSSTPLDDPRITRVGLFLRRYKLDELPQLFNIIKGDMSLVGPRPQVPWALNMEDPVNQIILSVRPGLTDYASVRFNNEGELLKGASNPDKAYFELIHPEKVRLAKEYVENVTLKTDFKLMGMTILTVLKRGGGENGQ